MTSVEMFGSSKWIDCPGSEAPLFRKEFTASAGEKAQITICGLGFFKLFINGKKVSDDLLTPAASTYSERDMSKFAYPLHDEMSYRIYCLKYDISDYLTDGVNVMTVMLGCGYYCQEHHFNEGYVSFGMPKMCYIIKKASGDVLCDETTLCHSGFMPRVHLYRGETQDYTLYPHGCEKPGAALDGFEKSREIDTPESDFMYQTAPADRVITSHHPELISEKNGTRLYDTGINTVGYAVIKCAQSGQKITVSYAEDIYDKPNFGMHFEENYQTEVFITDGENREYIPHFTWHGFRYFKIEGPGEVVRVDVVHSDCAVSSAFNSDNAQLNWLYYTYVHTQLCNMHAGIPSDCPHRERLGYTGDGQLCCEAAMLTLDSKEFYRKWLGDISDCQCRKSGHVQHTAPCMGGGGGPTGWGGAIVTVPWQFYKHYGEIKILEEFFPKMLKYLDYIESRSENGLVWCEEEGGWCLGDWLPPEPIKIPETYVNTCLAVGFIDRVIQIASILGRESEAEHLKPRAEKMRRAIKTAYFSPQQAAFCGDIQGASCLALNIGLGNEDVKNKVAAKYADLGMYDTGIIATEALTGWLFDNGHAQTAFELLASKKQVSFDYMARNGATTLWENWNGESSKNHPMFGAVTKYLFTRLLGITQPEDSAGFEKAVISPTLVDGLNRCSGSIETVRGKISVEYEKANGKVTFRLFASPVIECVFKFNGVTFNVIGNKELTFNI